MKTSDQLPDTVARHSESMEATQFYRDYMELSAKYNELQAKGVTSPRESQLRSISDPPVDPMSISHTLR